MSSRKKYVPKPIRIPGLIDTQMTADAHPALALQLHLATDALIRAPSVGECNNLSFSLCRIAGAMSHARKGAPINSHKDKGALAIMSAIEAIEKIIGRHDISEVVSVSSAEETRLRAAAGVLDTVLGELPLACYRRAERELKILEAA